MSASPQSQVTPQRLMQMAWGYAPPLIIEAAVKHRVFDVLDDGARSVEELAEATGTSPRGLRIIMNALVGFGLLRREAELYALAPESSAFLVSAKKESFFGGLFQHMSSQLVPNWLRLAEVVKTGRPVQAVNDQTAGAEFFQQFVEDIFPLSHAPARVLAASLDLAKATGPVSVLDIAAGSAVWSLALAEASPAVTVTAVDWPDVLPATRRTVERHGMAERYRYVAGDIHEADFGTGHAVATLGHILHSEGEARSRSLLKRVFDALGAGGTIAIAEFLVNDERTAPPQGLIFAVNMLVQSDQGDTFSFDEIAGWLSEAGFTDCRTLEAPGPAPLVLATKP